MHYLQPVTKLLQLLHINFFSFPLGPYYVILLVTEHILVSFITAGSLCLQKNLDSISSNAILHSHEDSKNSRQWRQRSTGSNICLSDKNDTEISLGRGEDRNWAVRQPNSKSLEMYQLTLALKELGHLCFITR